MGKMSYKSVGRRIVNGAFLVVLAILPLAPIKVSAATPGSLYSYDFRGATLGSPVANQAAANASVGLNLYGNWSKSDFGIHFDGDQVSKQSVAYAKPASGNTISIPANQALGGSVLYRYSGPSPGGGCVGDSRNITQIGRSGANLAQLKFQFSNCGTNSHSVYQECRVAGANTIANIPVARSSQALVTGATYLAQCIKSPDATGNTTVQLTTTRVDTTNGNFTTVDSIQIPAAGALTTTAYVSVGNKYALPTIAENTDQFVGDVAKVAYCSGSTATSAATCLNTELPMPPNITTQDVTTTTAVPFQQVSVNDPTLPIGTSQVTQQGVNGVETTVYTVTYTNGTETNRVVKSDNITTVPVDQITHVGTAAPVITTQDVTVNQDVPFQNVNVDDSTLPVGTNQVTQQGVNGVETIVYIVTYTNGVETGRVVESDAVTTAPVDQITHVGTHVPVITTQDVTATSNVPFQNVNVNDPTLPVGTSQVTQTGANGVETIVYIVTYSDGVETGRVVKSDNITTTPVNQITHVGTMPLTREYITNTSVETNNTGWTGLLNSNSKAVRITTDAQDGHASLEVSRLTTAGAAGVSAKPALVTSTVAGASFTGSVWVRAQAPGQTMTLQLKETNAAGTIVGSNSVSYTAPDTAWHQITTPYTTVGNGNSLGFVVSSPTMSAGSWFHVDTMSLIGPQ